MSRWGAVRVYHLSALPAGHLLYVPISSDDHWGTDTGTTADLIDVSPETTTYVEGAQWWYMEDYADLPHSWGAMAGQLVGNAFRAADGTLWLYGYATWPYNLDPTVPITNTRYDEKDMPWAMRWNPSTEQPIPAFWVPTPNSGPISIFGGTRTTYPGGIISVCDRLDGPGIYAVVHGIYGEQPLIVYYPGSGQEATTGATTGDDFVLSTGGMNSAGYPVGNGDVYSFHDLVPNSTLPYWPYADAAAAAAALPYWAGSPMTIFTHAGAYYCLAGGDFYYPVSLPNFNTYPPNLFNVQALWRCTTDPSDPTAWSLVRLLSNYDLNNWYGASLATPAQDFGLDWSFYNDQVDVRWAQAHAGSIYLSYAHTTSTYHGYATSYDLDNTTGIWQIDSSGTITPSYTMSFSGTSNRIRMMGPLAELAGTLYALEWEMPNTDAATDILTLRLLRRDLSGWTLINQFSQAFSAWGTRMWAAFFGANGTLWLATDRSASFGMTYSGQPSGTYPNFRVWRCDPTTIGATAAWTLWMNQPQPTNLFTGRQAASRIATRAFLPLAILAGS